MELKRTITVCFKEPTNLESGFALSELKEKSSFPLEFKPLFDLPKNDSDDDGDLLVAPYSEMSKEEQKLYRMHELECNIDDISQIEDMLRNDPNISFVEVNQLYETKFIPNDPAFPQLYGVQRINCPAAWNKTLGDGVTVAVIDSGVDYNHEDIKSNMWTKNGKYGYNFSENNDDPYDNTEKGHGTHVAGTIAAIANNNTGIIGVAPKAKIMAIKIFPNAYTNVIAKALKFAVDNGAKILNNSWGPTQRTPSSPTLEAAIDYVHSKGGICVFAAGNSGDDTKYYSPANYNKTIAVGATNSNNKRPTFSNHGKSVDIYAPGHNILSLQNKSNSYSYKSGTSMSAPHVSGALALLLSTNPHLTFNQILSKLSSSSTQISSEIKLLNCKTLV
ncbi:thermitase [Aquimarina sp. EL_43]|uniref:S8 family peptidase n=1 Tax=unclassified Aquimarina TaxID=2627091 RepID=UPI0018C93FBD|nr:MULTISPECIES: S8 family peptidase [unclassified Aquimarina]MBG6132483.1 thermitase [Aquimarina sp. EL_35]MBG6152614.1 thermitase [Aquimarina sp. EL_32]MBG6170459.1 thermitase [Aquimarina sp. EL_43]